MGTGPEHAETSKGGVSRVLIQRPVSFGFSDFRNPARKLLSRRKNALDSPPAFVRLEKRKETVSNSIKIIENTIAIDIKLKSKLLTQSKTKNETSHSLNQMK